MDEKDIWGVYKIIINECLNNNELDMAFAKDEIVNYLRSQLGDDPSLALDILNQFNNIYYKLYEVVFNTIIMEDYNTLEKLALILLNKHNTDEIKIDIKDISTLCNEIGVDLLLLQRIINTIGKAINTIWDEIEFGDGIF